MSTAILPFAVWASGTNQNSVPANDNSLRNQILNGLVISDSTTAQPETPTDGDIYIIPGSATGTQWETFDENDLAIYSSGTWYAYAPVDGIVVNVAGTPKQFDGSNGWVNFGAVESVNGNTGEITVLAPIIVACSDETTVLTTGAAKVTFRMPYAFTLTEIPRASLTTAPTGAALQVDINEDGVSIFSTPLTIDATEKTSTTAATPAVLSDTSLADDAEMTIDIDQIGSTIAGAGLKVTLIGHPT